MFSRVSKNAPKSAGPPIVLVHGLGVSSRYMTPLASEWAGTYSVYVPDLPGYGRSETPKHVRGVRELARSLHGWLRTVGIGQAAFVGNSMGCQILVELADLDPECILAAAFLGPTMDQNAATPFAHVYRLFKDQFREPVSLIPMQGFDYLSNGPLRTVLTFRHAVKHDMLGRVNRLRAPCLVMRGEHDPIVSEEWISELAKRMPAARTATVAAAGHALNYNSAGVIAPMILDFWRSSGIAI